MRRWTPSAAYSSTSAGQHKGIIAGWRLVDYCSLETTGDKRQSRHPCIRYEQRLGFGVVWRCRQGTLVVIREPCSVRTVQSIELVSRWTVQTSLRALVHGYRTLATTADLVFHQVIQNEASDPHNKCPCGTTRLAEAEGDVDSRHAIPSRAKQLLRGRKLGDDKRFGPAQVRLRG